MNYRTKVFSKKACSTFFVIRRIMLINNSMNLKKEKKNTFKSKLIKMTSPQKFLNKIFPKKKN